MMPVAGNEKKKILVVEDELLIGHVCSGVLSGEGFDVDVAVNGRVAQGMIKLSRYDLLLVDIKMPEVNGKQLYMWIKQKNPRLIKRIVFTSGSVIDENTLAFVEESGRPLLPKPFTPDDLTAIVKDTLERLENED
jgi:DNA-binding response OmpR family regulator